MIYRSTAFLALTLLTAGLYSAEQRSENVAEMTASNIESLLKEMNLPFTVGKDEEKKPSFRYISSGKTVIITLYGGTIPNNATSLGLSTSFEMQTTLEKVNSWNQNQRFLKAYQENPGTIVLEADIDMGGDPSKKNLERLITRMNRALLALPNVLE